MSSSSHATALMITTAAASLYKYKTTAHPLASQHSDVEYTLGDMMAKSAPFLLLASVALVLVMANNDDDAGRQSGQSYLQIYGGEKKRPNQSKDLYRLLRTLRSDPSMEAAKRPVTISRLLTEIRQRLGTLGVDLPTKHMINVRSKELIPDYSYIGRNDIFLDTDED
jgi:hypothetical protein